MTRKNHIKFLLFTVILLQNTQLKGAAGDWQRKMSGLAETMNTLLPELISKNGNPKIIEREAKKLSELSHEIQMGRASEKLMPPSDLDPGILFIASEFSDQSRRAYQAIKQGNLTYGKSLLRSATSYCIACHTRNENGPQFANFPLSPKVKGLSKQELGELFVATRQFDKGLAQFRELIADSELVKKRPFDWEVPVRQALALAVRVKKDPALASQIVTTALASPYLPQFQQERLLKWKKGIEAWQSESVSAPVTESQQVANLRRLLSEARGAQLFPIDRSAEIQFLRVSAVAHDLLGVAKDPKIVAEALMSAGEAYEILATPALWPMHEFYYESCVRKFPHSDLARGCYSRFTQAIYFGYTGSGGTNIPHDVQERLLELKSLSSESKRPGK